MNARDLRELMYVVLDKEDEFTDALSAALEAAYNLSLDDVIMLLEPLLYDPMKIKRSEALLQAMSAVTVAALFKESEGKKFVIKVNTDELRSISRKFKGPKGEVDEEKLESALEKVLQGDVFIDDLEGTYNDRVFTRCSTQLPPSQPQEEEE